MDPDTSPSSAPPLPRDVPGLPPLPDGIGLLASAGLIALAAGLVQALPPGPEPARPLFFLVAVLVAAVTFGFWTGLSAAIGAFAALNFLYTAPLYTFHIARAQDFYVLVIFLLVAGLAGLLAGRLHDRAEAARARAEALEVLGALSAELGLAETRGAALAAARGQLQRLGGGAVSVALQDGVPVADAALLDTDLAAAERALRNQRPEPAPAPGWPGARFSFLPVAPDLALGHPRLDGREGPRRALAITALAEQTRLALQRLDYAEKARQERLRAETEATRSAVLTSLSHDLRTPLATILGAASALRELDMAPEARADLLAAIEEEAGRMNRHVTNLLQLTRLELATPMRPAWVDLNDIAEAAVARARRAFKGAEVALDLAPLPMIRAEGALLEQAVFNLIDNALHHGRAPVRLATRAGQGAVTLTLRDGGDGPPQAIRAWLDGPDLRPAPGQRGLGLAVAKGIARHQSGRLTWDGGFTLSLPEAP